MNTNFREHFSSGSDNFIWILGENNDFWFGSSHVHAFTYISSRSDKADLESDSGFSDRKDIGFHNGKEKVFSLWFVKGKNVRYEQNSFQLYNER